MVNVDKEKKSASLAENLLSIISTFDEINRRPYDNFLKITP